MFLTVIIDDWKDFIEILKTSDEHFVFECRMPSNSPNDRHVYAFLWKDNNAIVKIDYIHDDSKSHYEDLSSMDIKIIRGKVRYK